MDTKVVFTDSFKAKTKGKKLSTREIGKLRWQKVVEAEKRDELQFCNTRKDVAAVAGYDRDEARGATWVRNMINRGHLIETLAEAKGIYSTYYYSVGSKPKHKNFTTKAGPRTSKRAIIKCNSVEVELNNYSAEEIAIIIRETK